MTLKGHPELMPVRLDVQANTITVAVTVQYHRPWGVDSCEASELVGAIRRLMDAYCEGREKLSLVRAETWDPDNERALVSPVLYL